MDRKLHTPVMMDEILDFLNLSAGMTILDATLGTAGHSEAILSRISPGGKLIGIDRDAEAVIVSGQRLKNFAGSFELVHGNFLDLDTILNNLNIAGVDGILFDLGVSSYQLDDPSRGFSFQQEGPLDMRLDQNSYISAYDLLNNLNEKELSHLIWRFGQERWHNRIAHILVEERQRQPIATTQQLAQIVVKAIPCRYRHRFYRIHPATRTFQAVRIAVNRELETLEVAINKAINVLKKNGRICVISFHSLEDRIVKHGFRNAAAEGLVKVITAKPLSPRLSEIEANPRSRSAKLRVAQKL